MGRDKENLDQSLKAADASMRKSAPKPFLATPKPSSLAARLSPPAQNRTIKPSKIEDVFPESVGLKLSFLGSGQGGARIAQAYWDIGYRRVCAFNTTETDFQGIAAEMPKLSLDVGGAQKDMQLARAVLKGRDDEVWDLMTRGWGASTEWAMITASLGGGTGSGTVLPLVLQARKYLEAQKQPPRVGAVVSLPGYDDGQVMARNALTAFRELVENRVSPIIVIDNERVHEVYKPEMNRLLPKSNELVSHLLHLFNVRSVVRSQYMTFDVAEFAHLLSGGITVMGSANIDVETMESPANVTTAIREQLAKNVLADVDLRAGYIAACLIIGSADVLGRFSKDYFSAGFMMLDRLVGSSRKDLAEVPTVVHRGLYEDEDPEAVNSLQCYTMVSGLDAPATRLKELAKQAGLLGRPQAAKATGAQFLNVD